MNKYSGAISGEYTLLSSLSHIGESQGVDSYLNTQHIVNGDKIEEVFVYNGNAIRGALRDNAAKYLLTKNEEDIKVSKNMFQLLFSGGNISGEHKTDVKAMREIRERIPLVSLFGGGIGNNILSGKMDVSDAYLLCKETSNVVPNIYEKECIHSWRQLTSERSYTRMDDTKDVNKIQCLNDIEMEEKKKGEASTQMRYTVETLNAGAKMYQMIQLENLTLIELGCLVSAIKTMSETPYLGGKKNIGMGRYTINYKFQEEDFFKLDKDGIWFLSSLAEKALQAYENHIKDIDITEIDIWSK